jgi:hypothetical protein
VLSVIAVGAIATLLTVTGVLKILRPAPPGSDVFARLPGRWGRRTATGLAAGEVALAVALLASHGGAPLSAFAAVALTVGAVVRSGLYRSKSGRSCGCAGARTSALTRWALVQAWAAPVVAAMATARPPAAFTAPSLLLGAALGVALCPVSWRRRPAARPVATGNCASRRATFDDAAPVIHGSREWSDHLGLLRSTEPIEVWRDGCWYFAVYRGQQDGDDVEVVFGARIDADAPQCRVSVVPVNEAAGVLVP